MLKRLSTEQKNYISEHINTMPVEEIAVNINWKVTCLRTYLYRQGLIGKKAPLLSSEQEKYVRENFDTIFLSTLAKTVGVPITTLRTWCIKQGLFRTVKRDLKKEPATVEKVNNSPMPFVRPPAVYSNRSYV